jgi:hypothetical protein
MIHVVVLAHSLHFVNLIVKRRLKKRHGISTLTMTRVALVMTTAVVIPFQLPNHHHLHPHPLLPSQVLMLHPVFPALIRKLRGMVKSHMSHRMIPTITARQSRNPKERTSTTF